MKKALIPVLALAALLCLGATMNVGTLYIGMLRPTPPSPCTNAVEGLELNVSYCPFSYSDTIKERGSRFRATNTTSICSFKVTVAAVENEPSGTLRALIWDGDTAYSDWSDDVTAPTSTGELMFSNLTYTVTADTLYLLVFEWTGGQSGESITFFGVGNDPDGRWIYGNNTNDWIGIEYDLRSISFEAYSQTPL